MDDGAYAAVITVAMVSGVGEAAIFVDGICTCGLRNAMFEFNMGTLRGSLASWNSTSFKGGSEVISAPQKVIGHYPEYVELSAKLNTKPFSIPDNIWNKMTSAEQWAANQKFLDRAISKGTEFNLATPIDKVRPGSYLQKEIEYLMSQGYKLSSDGTKLIK